LAEHHATAAELVVGFHKRGSGRASMTWTESAREALCFGWIDGIRRSLGEESYTIRCTLGGRAAPGARSTFATSWVVSAKREETRARRLARLIEDSAAGRRLA
jgi:uncharacterized protein YdeI (YjbR/CyaY-like superfamily)